MQTLVLTCLAMVLACLAPFAYSSVEYEVPSIDYSTDASFPISIGTQMLYFEDAEHTLTSEQVLSNPNLPWNTIDKASPNFGFTHSLYWFRFNLENKEFENHEVLIELPIAFLDSIKLYQFSGQEVLQKH